MGRLTKKFQNCDIISLTKEVNTMLTAKNKVYPQQVKCAIDVFKYFDADFPNANYVITKGKTQAGKTGVLTAISCLMRRESLIDVFKKDGSTEFTFYYITGDNSRRLSAQSAERIEECFDGWDGVVLRVLKNSDLKKDSLKRCNDITNSFIFIDESHYGTKDAQNILQQWLWHHGLNMRNNCELEAKHVYIVSNTATPYDEVGSDVAYSKGYVELSVEPWCDEKQFGYVGFSHFYCENNIKGMERQISEDDATVILEHLQALENKTGIKKAVILRHGKPNDVKKMFEKFFDVRVYASGTNANINYAQIEKDLEHYNDTKNDKYLMIIVKGAYRMGISIPDYCKRYIGAVVDYSHGSAVKSVITTEQGLLGRVSGYWKNDSWKDLLIFINGKHVDSLKGCYIDGSTETPQSRKKVVFEEREDGDWYEPLSTGETWYTLDEETLTKLKSQREYYKDVQTFLESENEEFKNYVYIRGRKVDSKTQKTIKKLVFDMGQGENENANEQIAKRAYEGGNKNCYTTLLDIDKGEVGVLFGVIQKGVKTERFNEEHNVYEPLDTSRKD